MLEEDKLLITCNVWTSNQIESIVSVDLRDKKNIDDSVQKSVDKAEDSFRFSFTMPDPSSMSDADAQNGSRVWNHAFLFILSINSFLRL